MAAIEKNGVLNGVLRDQCGSVVKIVDAGLNTVADYCYNAFGENDGNFSSPWQYSAERVDPDTGLIHFPKRVYDPKVGRWLTPDPLGFADGPNLYSYVHNNPLTHIDPLGLYSQGLKDFSMSLGRGFTDDFSWGVIEQISW
jgi:RHS repeat-associated protein